MYAIIDRFGLAGTDIVNQLHRSLADVQFMTEKEKLAVTEAMAEADFRLVEGGGESLQLDALTARISTILKIG
jgi:replication factor C small subunit